MNILLIFLSGFILSLSFPNFFKIDGSFLAYIALFPLFIALKNQKISKSFKIGFISGLFYFLFLLYWLVPTIRIYGEAPIYYAIPIYFLLSTYLALYIGVFGACFSLFMASNIKKPILFFIIPAAWTALEYIRTMIPILGFSWGVIGYSQFKFLNLIQFADLTGVYGVSFILVLSNMTLFFIYSYISSLLLPRGALYLKTNEYGAPLKFEKNEILIYSAIFIAVLGILLFYGNIKIAKTNYAVSKADEKNIAIVQGNIDQRIKLDENSKEEITKKYINLSKEASKKNPDLIILPETALPFLFIYNKQMTESVISEIKKLGSDFLIGCDSVVWKETNPFLLNSAYLINKNGKIMDRYDKLHLVPFGEYVPFKKPLWFLQTAVPLDIDFIQGIKEKTIKWNKDDIAVLICFEITFPNLVRKIAQKNAAFIATITNDAWFGKSPAPFQHFSISVFRAIENRKSIVRCANTGISGLIAPTGKIEDSTDIFKEEVKIYKVPIIDKKSFYGRYGDIFALLCLVISVLCSIRGFIIYKRRYSE